MYKKNNTLGKILKLAREEADISVETLAIKVGVTSSYIYRIEKGSQKPSFDILYCWIRELYISPDLIFYPEMSTKRPRIENLVRMLSVCDDNELALVTATVKALLKQ